MSVHLRGDVRIVPGFFEDRADLGAVLRDVRLQDDDHGASVHRTARERS